MSPDVDPWFRDGLRFECTRCGNCCTGEPGYIWVDDAEIAALAADREMPVEHFVAAYVKAVRGRRTLREKPGGECVFYDAAKGCTIYSLRPRQCRTWPFWESNVSSPAAWQAVQRTCPGAGRGELIPAEEIARRLKVIRL